jgi:hypothetical protein
MDTLIYTFKFLSFDKESSTNGNRVKRVRNQDTGNRKKTKCIGVNFDKSKNTIDKFIKYRNYKMSAKYSYGITRVTRLEKITSPPFLSRMRQYPYDGSDGIN